MRSQQLLSTNLHTTYPRISPGILHDFILYTKSNSIHLTPFLYAIISKVPDGNMLLERYFLCLSLTLSLNKTISWYDSCETTQNKVLYENCISIRKQWVPTFIWCDHTTNFIKSSISLTTYDLKIYKIIWNKWVTNLKVTEFMWFNHLNTTHMYALFQN